MSLETDTHKKIFEAWEKESESTLLFLQENGKAITVDGKKIRIDIPSKLLLDLRNGHNIAKLVDWNHEETQSGGYLAAIPCPEYRIDGETYTAIGTVYDHAKLDSMLKLKGYNGNAYLFMLDNEGNITYTNQSEDIFFRNYSLLKHLKKAQTITENEAAFLRKKIEEKEAGVLLLGKASRYYLGYAPIESNNTTLICIVPKGIVDNVLRDYQKTVWFATVLMVSFIFLLWIGLTWSVFKLSIADQKAEYEKRNNELQLQTMKKMEEANKKLKKAKNIATEALQTAENANKAKTDFLSNMSHDIRTPMNVILGYNQLMKTQLTEPKQLDYQKKIEQSGKLLLSIINNVLDMARIESGKMKVDENYERVGEVVDEIISTFASEAEEKGIHLSGNMQVTHRNVLCDGTKIREIREHNTTTGKVGGTGLGMPIVKKMVDLLGGSIEVESELGKGTVFTVTLMHKMADKKYYSQKIETVIASDMGENLRGKHVLLAEDNDLNAEIAVTVLEETGLVIERVEDGIQCVNRVEQMSSGTYDLILMDIQMPNMDGYKATKCIRHLQDIKKAEIPIIAMTANAFEEDRKKAFDAGMNEHIAKPIDIEKLRAVILSVLNKQEN